ncbi:trna wybutosine-synthesizing protein 2 [Diplodia corticola]|uniref:tRNA(Phe) (4-demethylwyosine(37)-C(7)) aminocarboxypropyltransferase n=1 Tax=Diplodia corticola TaxID=236234 RepID=A0A1J9RGE4_9PEZI|nr:trna wybutosine-synthesizing protein 2 [Diplodia corticola]OJD40606.1 trna wybutosine-synthesizing protein 2 [Diplodia corticola]
MAHSARFSDSPALVVPAQNVKAVKTFLEEHRLLDKRRKIAPYTAESTRAGSSARDQTLDSGKLFIVPFLPVTTSINETDAAIVETYFGDLTPALTSRLPPDALTNISITNLPKTPVPETASPPTTGQPHGNPLRAAFHSALVSSLPAETLSTLSLTPAQLAADLPGTYSIYPPLLLLPAHTFHRPSWTALLAAHDPPSSTTPLLRTVLAHVAQRLAVTHVALNAPIALHNDATATTAAAADQPSNQAAAAAAAPAAPAAAAAATTANILRAPHSLTPLHGDFGPPPCHPPTASPSPADFTAALWATARQNGITQTWAPLHTMFSRGNVKEKARILSLGAVRDAVRQGEGGAGAGAGGEDIAGAGAGTATGCAAVDLYAGIGYFAFSYRKAGVRTVLGWEINAWSVEGLRRGAGANGWGVEVVVVGGGEGGGDGDGDGDGDDWEGLGEDAVVRDFVVFRESNVRAARRVERLRGRLPPVRHVNAGLLPTSRGAWETAVRVLDPGLGGWVHLHENFGEGEVGRKAGEVVEEVRRIWGVVRAERCGGGIGDGLEGDDVVKLEHVERVKTYAPGVLHCVLDIWISPTGNQARS